MKLATLQAGQFVETGGYYTKGDAGAARYLIVAAQAFDGYGDHALANGTVAVLQRNKVLYASQWGAIDGSDNTATLKAMSSKLVSFDTVDLEGMTHIISAVGLPALYLGHSIFDLNDKNNVTFIGNRATVKCVNHNVGTNGGLAFIRATACSNLTVETIDFDMTFVGVNTSSSYYPQCGGIIGLDDTNAVSGVRTQDGLNNNWKIQDCTFKLFHPYGSYAQSGNAYAGDPNNGFKIYPITVFGPFDSTIHENQPRKITIDNCTLKEGGNSYGFWAWAWNDVKVINCSAQSFVGKQSNESGVYSGRGNPMIRYHQFHCQGFNVLNNHFRAKPCSERTTAGFEGDARFVDYNTNLLGNYGHGGCTITGNTIISGRGDSANSAQDNYISLTAYGSISVGDNTFESTSETTNAITGSAVFWNAEAVGGQGNATLVIVGNTFNAECDWLDNISINNGASTLGNRRLKQLVITGNSSLGQAQSFLKMSITSVSFGVQDLKVGGNTISGEFNTQWDKNSSNSRAIEVSSSEATDVLDVSRNTIRDKFYGIETNNAVGRFTADYNEMIGVTTRWLGSIPIISDRRDNAPSEVAADGSFYHRTNGVAGGAVFYRIGGVWVNVG